MTAKPPPQAPRPVTAESQRRKLTFMLLVFGPIVLLVSTYLIYGAIKMSRGVPVGYDQRDLQTGEIKRPD